MAKSLTAGTFEHGGSFIDRVKLWPQRTKAFYTEVRTEMKKVTNPSRKEVQATTLVVIITVGIFGLYFWAVDSIIGRGVDFVLRHFANS